MNEMRLIKPHRLFPRMLQRDPDPAYGVAFVVVLLILIPIAWLAAVLFALAMCRIAALSDRRHAAGLVEWIATSNLAGHRAAAADSPAEQLPLDRQRAAHRARGRS